MNRAETLQIMSILRTAYPSYYKGMSKNEAESVVALWTDRFSQDDPQQVVQAVYAFIDSASPFPPNIGQVKEKMRSIFHTEEMTEQEAWQKIAAACTNGIYDSEREFEKLPPTLKRLVGSPNQLREWAMLDASELQTVVASNVQRSYREVAKREREIAALPENIRKTLTAVGDALALEKKAAPKLPQSELRKILSAEELARRLDIAKSEVVTISVEDRNDRINAARSYK